MRPCQVIRRYHHLNVPLDPPEGSVEATVKIYACERYGTGQEIRRAYRVRLHRAASGEIRRVMTDREYGEVFTGQGTPENIAKCLRVSARHRVFTHTVGGPPMDVKAGVQNVARQYIGLDCVGFVGNWARLAGVRNWSVSRPPLDWLSHAMRRTAVSDVSKYDIIVWCNGNHIAVIESTGALTGRGRRASVCESAAGGPQQNNYTLRQVSTPITGQRRNGSTYSTNIVADAPNHGANIPVFIGRLRGLP